MKHTPLLLPFALGALLTGCATTEPTASQTLETRFARYDLDKNGKITRIELGEGNTEDTFFYYDSDGNKIVTTAEFFKLGGKPETFAKLDKNKDGQLTLVEVKTNPKVVTAMSTTFATIDTDKNGSIDKAEAKQYQSVRQQFTP